MRIHTGGTADTAARAINARAFSLGNSIAFANGEYQPGTHSGRTLMAHEITHTLQGGGGVRRKVHKIHFEMSASIPVGKTKIPVAENDDMVIKETGAKINSPERKTEDTDIYSVIPHHEDGGMMNFDRPETTQDYRFGKNEVRAWENLKKGTYYLKLIKRTQKYYGEEFVGDLEVEVDSGTVSYTHLTLPTICSV